MTNPTGRIAVIGLACRLPGADSAQEFWHLLKRGRTAISSPPRTRRHLWDSFDKDPDAPGSTYIERAGYLDDIDAFDAEFFGISALEAVEMDPQHRILLEICWHALEDAGIVPASLGGSRTGVFVGISGNEYEGLMRNGRDSAHIGPYTLTGNLSSVGVGRLSYHLDLRGPSLAVDTLCSSSLLSTHLAMRSLRSKECDLAIAGGVTLLLASESYVSLSKVRALSPDGTCKTFDEDANGYARGEGCGLLILKRLPDAVRDGDRILAVLRGSAVNHDGRSNGMTAPNGLAQEEVIRAALADAGAAASDISYVEAHGTGTALGDPVELLALQNALGAAREPGHPLLVGSVKANVGHLEFAAGVTGLIKVILALQNRQLPPQPGVATPNRRFP